MQSSSSSVIDEVIEILRQGRDLLARIDDAAFGRSIPPLIHSAVGSHMRHCLDFYSCFLRGLAVRRIDYDGRERDASLERDRGAAMQKLESLMQQLRALAIADEEQTILVRLEDAAIDQQWSRSSIARELQSLKSHTIHHYALIAVLLRLQGIEPHEEFGVSTATLRHRRVA
jgi:hypothetical protein